MKCPNCKETDHEPTAKFCHVCGTKFDRNSVFRNTHERHKIKQDKGTLHPPSCPYKISQYGRLSATSLGVVKGELSIPSIIEGQKVTYIEDKAFMYNKKIDSVIIPNTVCGIGASAFQGCRRMKVAVIPDSVAAIEESAFNGCDSLLRVDLSASLTEIAPRLFFGCKRLIDIDLPPYVRYIGREAFQETAIKSVVIPNTVSCIGEKAFYCCRDMYKVVIPDRTMRIDAFAFGQCISLKTIVIPKSILLSEYAFVGCKNLCEITISRNNFEKIKKNIPDISSVSVHFCD